MSIFKGIIGLFFNVEEISTEKIFTGKGGVKNIAEPMKGDYYIHPEKGLVKYNYKSSMDYYIFKKPLTSESVSVKDVSILKKVSEKKAKEAIKQDRLDYEEKSYNERLSYAKNRLYDCGYNENHKTYKDAIDALNRLKTDILKIENSSLMDTPGFEYMSSYKLTRECYVEAAILVSSNYIYDKYHEEWIKQKEKFKYAEFKSFAAERIGEELAPLLGRKICSFSGYGYEGAYIGGWV